MDNIVITNTFERKKFAIIEFYTIFDEENYYVKNERNVIIHVKVGVVFKMKSKMRKTCVQF